MNQLDHTINQIYERSGGIPSIVRKMFLMHPHFIGMPKKCIDQIYELYCFMTDKCSTLIMKQVGFGHIHSINENNVIWIHHDKYLYELLHIGCIFKKQWVDFLLKTYRASSHNPRALIPAGLKISQLIRQYDWMGVYKEIGRVGTGRRIWSRFRNDNQVTLFFLDLIHASYFEIRKFKTYSRLLSEYLFKYIHYNHRVSRHIQHLPEYLDSIDLECIDIKSHKCLSPPGLFIKYKRPLVLAEMIKALGDNCTPAFRRFMLLFIEDGYGIKDILEMNELYQKSQNVPMPSWSNWLHRQGAFSSRFLPRNDDRGLVLGYYTDCCQNYPHDCTKLGQSSPDACFWIVEKRIHHKQEIIAQSCVFQENGRICFDNVECRKNYKNNLIVQSLFEKTVEHLSSFAHIVTIGSRYNDIDTSRYIKRARVPKNSLVQKLDGSDAKQQLIVGRKSA